MIPLVRETVISYSWLPEGEFYDFLGIYMPDWKERKKVLDQDVVHGL